MASSHILDDPSCFSSATSTTTAALSARLAALRSRSSQLSGELLAKLTATSSTWRHPSDPAASPTGSLLHISSAISSIVPPQLQTLDQELLRPLLVDVAELQQVQKRELDRILLVQRELEDVLSKGQEAHLCQRFYQDWDTVERILQETRSIADEALTQDYTNLEILAASLQRAAHLIHSLSEQVASASEQVRLWTSTNSKQCNKTEMTHFILKMGPQVRQAKDKLCQILLQHLELILAHHKREATEPYHNNNNNNSQRQSIPVLKLIALGHIFTSLTLLKETSAAERVFVKTVTMPIIRSFLLPNTTAASSGGQTSTALMIARLDEGGPRGECAGLSSLLSQILQSLKEQWGDLLVYMEDIIYGHLVHLDPKSTVGSINDTSDYSSSQVSTVDPPSAMVDLLTSGIWIPIVTVLTADTSMKMAIFSPGIAHVLQSNYTTLDTCITNFTHSLLGDSKSNSCLDTTRVENQQVQKEGDVENLEHLYHHPNQLCSHALSKAQARVQSHTSTIDFYKKFNLPIYYQLRFAEVSSRVQTALDTVQKLGWNAQLYTGTYPRTSQLHLFIFWELQDCLEWMWKSNVYLKPMTHRFMRGVVQIIGRIISFITDGLDGKLLFGVSSSSTTESESVNSDHVDATRITQDETYQWVDRIDDVASVSCDLALFKTWLLEEYLEVIRGSISAHVKPDDSMDTIDELNSLCRQILLEATDDLDGIVQRSWDEVITQALSRKCAGPIAAVKGIAATFRMTNRPPPTLSSPFVATILRPLKEFNATCNRVPLIVGYRWKLGIVSAVADKYCSAVAELIDTVQKTEDALKNRKGRKNTAAGLSDGDKVKMQLYLDSQEFARQIQQLDIDPSSIEGVSVLLSITEDGKDLFEKTALG